MTASYHNHTTWSDGEPTVAEQIAAARDAGIAELGISDHFTLHHHGLGVEWSMPVERLDEYVAALREAAATTEGVTLRVGVEADFVPETAAETRRRLAAMPLDFVIGSVHFLDDFAIDSVAADWERLSPDERDEKWRLYWVRIRQLAESGIYDWVGHLDLPKKFGFRPLADLTRERESALDALAAGGMALEVNTAGWRFPAAEAYPSLDLLRAAREREIPLLITADAHRTAHLSYRFTEARALAFEAGYRELVGYRARERFAVPLG